jgi:hypothetical protein
MGGSGAAAPKTDGTDNTSTLDARTMTLYVDWRSTQWKS